MRYFVELSYRGTRFHGWQYQPNALSIQEVLEKSFSLLLRNDIKLTGAGRTDTGVHARRFFAHFDIDAPIEEPHEVLKRLNSFIDRDIAIHRIYPVAGDLHARFSAISRTYHYSVHLEKNPFISDFSYRLYFRPDFDKMNEAAKILFDYIDFTSFSKLHTDTKTNDCKIFRAEWIQRDLDYVFVIKADRFLRNMVRAITGTLLEVGKKKMNLEQFRSIVESRDRKNAGMSVPSHGLCLFEIEYPENI